MFLDEGGGCMPFFIFEGRGMNRARKTLQRIIAPTVEALEFELVVGGL